MSKAIGNHQEFYSIFYALGIALANCKSIFLTMPFEQLFLETSFWVSFFGFEPFDSSLPPLLGMAAVKEEFHQMKYRLSLQAAFYYRQS